MPRSTLLRKLRVTPTRAASPARVSPRSVRNSWIRPPNWASRSIATVSVWRRPFFALGIRRALSDHLSRQFARVETAVVDHHLAVDHDVVDPGRLAGRLGIGGSIVDGRRIENHEVREGAGTDHPAFFEPEPLRWEQGDAADAVLEREELPVAHEVAEDARHGAVTGGVRDALAGDDGVRLERGIGVRHQRLQPGLLVQLPGHTEVEAHRVPALLQGQIGRHLERRFTPLIGDGLQTLALE